MAIDFTKGLGGTVLLVNVKNPIQQKHTRRSDEDQ
jgi:hypothetical protein